MKKILSFNILFFVLFNISLAGNIQVGTISYPVDTMAHFKVGPGTFYTAINLIHATKPLQVFFLEVDVKNPFVQVKTILAKDSVVTGETPLAMATRKSKEGAVYFAGTNGDFFVTVGKVGRPTGGCMVDGEIAVMPNTSPSIAFDRNISSYIGVKTFAGNVNSAGNILAINDINNDRGTNELILYNSMNGHYTHTNSSGTEVLVQLIDSKWDVNKTLQAKVINVVSGKGNMNIPAGYAVLSGNGTAQTYLNTFKVNDQISINLGITIDSGSELPSFTDMVSGDRFILKDGVVTDNDWVDVNPRTCIGNSADKSKIIFCVVDGRSVVSVGVSTKQLADIIKSAGAYTALNLDGGGSSCMYIKEFNEVNNSSQGTERAVGNGIYAFSSAPTDNTISEINPYEKITKLPRYGVFKPKFMGFNKYGTLLNKEVQNVTLTCPPELGYINNAGQFVATGNQNGIITANYNGIQTTVNIVLVNEATISFRLDSILIDNRFEYPLEVQSIIGQNTLQVLPAALNWTIQHPEICSIDINGILKGLKNGITKVIGNLGSFKDSLQIKVEISETQSIVHDDFNNFTSWKITAPSSTWGTALVSGSLPNGWTHGAAIKYTYKTARTPSIKMAKSMRLYSLPDTIKLVANAGNVEINKIIIGLHTNNQTLSTATTFTAFPKNTDTEFKITTTSIATDLKDIASYPIWFDYFTMYIVSTSQVANTVYNIYLKEIALCYKNIILGVENPNLLSNIFVYPNPVDGNEVVINLDNSNPQNVSIQVFDVNGKLVQSENLGLQQTGDIQLKLHNIASGTYFMKIFQGENAETIKLIKR